MGAPARVLKMLAPPGIGPVRIGAGLRIEYTVAVIRPDHQRQIRSYVRREGRLTPAQGRALEQFWPRFGIDFEARLIDFDETFGRRAPRVLEIGFGDGDTLAHLASTQPGTDFIGIEVHRPGLGRLLNRITRDGSTNVRLLCHDAVEVLQHQIGPATLSGVNIFFPDPWPKKRHHKRRLIQAGFLDLLAPRMRAGATLHVATDWMPYAEHIVACLETAPGFAAAAPRTAEELEALRPETKFERRGRRLGHEVRDIVYTRA